MSLSLCGLVGPRPIIIFESFPRHRSHLYSYPHLASASPLPMSMSMSIFNDQLAWPRYFHRQAEETPQHFDQAVEWLEGELNVTVGDGSQVEWNEQTCRLMVNNGLEDMATSATNASSSVATSSVDTQPTTATVASDADADMLTHSHSASHSTAEYNHAHYMHTSTLPHSYPQAPYPCPSVACSCPPSSSSSHHQCHPQYPQQ